MKQGLIVIDLDGTALNEWGQLTDRTKRALARARQAGYEVLIATGRPPRSSLPYQRELALQGPLITFNGAWVQHEDPLYHCHFPLKLELVWPILQECRRFAVENIMTEIGDRFYVWRRDEVSDFLAGGESPAAVGLPERLLSHDPTEVLVRTREEEAPEMMQALLQRFGGEVDVRYWGGFFQVLEIRRAGITKVSALNRIVAQMGLSREQVIAFGDGHNDVAMLEWAGCGVAMGNAAEEVRRKADRVAGANGQDGVAAFLEKELL